MPGGRFSQRAPAPPAPSSERTLAGYAARPALLERLDEAVGPAWTTRFATRWRRFLDLVVASSVAVVGLETPDRWSAARLSSWRTRGRGCALLLTLSEDPSWIPVLASAGVRASTVVWWRDLERRMPRSLERCGALMPLELACGLVGSSAGLTGTLERALLHVLRRRPPLSSVNRWAAEIPESRSTLFRHWRRTFGRDPVLSPKGLVEWLLLLHAVALRGTGKRWGGVARRLGISPRTLRRISGRRLQRSLADLAGARGSRLGTPGSRFLDDLRRLVDSVPADAPA